MTSFSQALHDARAPISFYLEVRAKAAQSEPLDAVAATLSTVGLDGTPNARMVLVKEVDDEQAASPGFVFYTNRHSEKGRELAQNPVASLVFHYPSIGVQVRIRGSVSPTSDARSDAYFASRPRQSQLGAWASEQSQPIESLKTVQDRFSDFERQYEGEIVPRPPHWGGYRLAPMAIEFWFDGAHRLHERLLFERKDGVWDRTRLAP